MPTKANSHSVGNELSKPNQQRTPAPAILAVVGCGLIGGSFALAVQQAGVVQQVRVYNPNPTSAALAVQLGVATSANASLAEAVTGADIVLLAMPLAASAACLNALAEHADDAALLMDIGSIKAMVLHMAQAAFAKRPTLLRHFVPAHPIAGKEKAGVEHAEAHLFQGKRSIICPHAALDPHYLARATQLWQACGSVVEQMDLAQHDHVFAAVSHLPHVVAYALIDALRQQEGGAGLLAMSGAGLQDTTRIAASPAHVWRDILHLNRHALRPLLRQYMAQLQQWDALLDDPEALGAQIAATSAARIAMDT